MKTNAERIGLAEQILMDYGVSPMEVHSALRDIFHALMGRDVYDDTLDDKQAICNAMCEAIRLTRNGGMDNALTELIYLPEEDKVRPVFEDGTGSNGYYDIDVAWDSGTAMIVDIASQFIKKMW